MIQELRPEELSTLRVIYESAFPVEERRKWPQIVSPQSVIGPKLSVLRDMNGKLIGLLTYWTFRKFVYIEHFAVDSRRRGGGLGSSALRDFLGAQSLPVVLEVEKAETGEIARRRIEFYRRHGFEIISHDYVQPPYAPGLPSVELDLMATCDEVDAGDVVRNLYSYVYGKAD